MSNTSECELARRPGAEKKRLHRERLVIGWSIDHLQDPRYWSATGGKSPPREDDFVSVFSKELGHTIVLGQSGSGKSYFLGRLLEEIVDARAGRCVVLDPNGDFRNFRYVRRARKNNYDSSRSRGWLSQEQARSDFGKDWKKRVRNYRHAKADAANSAHEKQLRLVWQYLNADVIGHEISDPIERDQLRQWHRAIRALSRFRYRFTQKPVPLDRVLLDAEQLGSRPDRREWLENAYAKQLRDDINMVASALDPEFRRKNLQWIDTRVARILQASAYASPRITNFYLTQARQLDADGMGARFSEAKGWDDSTDVTVFDLLAVQDRRNRSMIISSILEGVHRRAFQQRNTSERTFLVIDEAHNVIPAVTSDPRAIAIREQVRTIASEGRKFGLFLILVSQRPDKLDEQVVSECPNKVVMHLDTERVAETAEKLLGLSGLVRAVDLKQGRGIVAGPWLGLGRSGVEFACGGRRTLEGTEDPTIHCGARRGT